MKSYRKKEADTSPTANLGTVAEIVARVTERVMNEIEMHTLAKMPITSLTIRDAVLGGMQAPPPAPPPPAVVDPHALDIAAEEAKRKEKIGKSVPPAASPKQVTSPSDDYDDYDDEDEDYEDEDEDDDPEDPPYFMEPGWDHYQKRLYLFVPIKSKDKAKRYGAKWDTARKQWYALPSILSNPRYYAALKHWFKPSLEYGIDGYGPEVSAESAKLITVCNGFIVDGPSHIIGYPVSFNEHGTVTIHHPDSPPVEQKSIIVQVGGGGGAGMPFGGNGGGGSRWYSDHAASRDVPKYTK